MPIDFQRVQSVFQAVAELPSAERAAALERECGDDVELRRRVEALLQAHDDPGELPAAEPEPTGAYVPAVEPGQVFAGRYKLREKLGEGGMGVVFVADQTEPVQRRVALKIIRAGLDTYRLLARFEQERQALALMDHPNIAKVFDAGVDQAQRPYFAMELVKGLSLTRYCDDAKLSPRQRLELFIPVCQAVQHAHQKGIIHRDLKPSNILVGLYDGRPVPKVIDFGVAKATGPRLTEQSIYTEVGSIIGTLEYMSPEQAELNNLDIDTRSDIYALGVILYELLTGAVPFSRKELEKAGLAEMLRVIKEEEPPRPSTKLSHSGTLPSIAAHRQMEPHKLTALVRGELDWIVMKALEKDRGRRYETANGFAMDVQRYLGGEPVLAAPPSASYRLRKLARKYRAALTTATAIVLLLVAGITVSAWQAVRATKAEGAARVAEREALEAQQAEATRAESEAKAKQEALAAAGAERKALAQAQKRLAQIAKSNDIITSIFADLDIDKVKEGSEPLEAVLGQRLVKAANDLEGEAVGDPLVVAGLQHRLGQSLLQLGMAEQAVSLFGKARDTRAASLGADHPDTLRSMNDLGDAYRVAGKLDVALPLLEETLKLRKARLGPDHPDTLESMNDLGVAFGHAGKWDQSVRLLEETVKLRKAKLGVDDPETLISMSSLALAYHRDGKLNPAMELDKAILKILKAKLGPDHPRTLASMHNLAEDYQALGKLDQALPLLEETLKLQKIRLGADHPSTLESMNNLAGAYRTRGRLDRALPLMVETLKLMKAKHGADHPSTLTSMNNLALAYQDAWMLDRALPLMVETLEVTKAKLGADHPNTLVCMNNLAKAYQQAGKLDRALPLFEELLKLWKAKLGADHPNTIAFMGNLGQAYQEAGKLNLALPLLEESLERMKAKLGPEHPYTLMSMELLALAYKDAGKLDRSLPLLQEAARGMEKRRLEHRNAGHIVDSLAECLEDLKQFDQAEAWRRKWLAAMKEQSGPDSPRYAMALARLGLNLMKQKKWTDAEAAVRQCLAIRQKKEPDAWTTLYAQALVGKALLGQKKYADAEPLLLRGYEGIQQRAAKIPPYQRKARLIEALGYIVQLYDATGNKSEADKWRRKLEDLKKVATK